MKQIVILLQRLNIFLILNDKFFVHQYLFKKNLP
jgi:hypothetical protein